MDKEKRMFVVTMVWLSGFGEMGLAMPNHIDGLMELLKDNPNPSEIDVAKAIYTYFIGILDKSIEEDKKDYTEEEWAEIEAEAERQENEENLQRYAIVMGKKNSVKC